MKPHHSKSDISLDIAEVISRLGEDIKALDNKTILITGGTGFFGRWLLQILCTLILEKNFKLNIYVLSRNPRKFIDQNHDYPFKKNINFISGDVKNFRLPNIKIDYLIHMATTAASETFSGEDQLHKLDLLYLGTKNVLKNAIQAGVKKVLFTSSGVTYGPSTGQPFSEDMLQAPKTTLDSSALGEGKRLAEYLVNYFAKKGGYDYSIARCFSFFGPFLPLDLHYAIGNFINDALTKEDIVINGTGEELRSYLYIGDAWVWLLKLLVNTDNEIYNVGSKKSISIANLAKLVRDSISPGKEIKCLGQNFDVGNYNRNLYLPNTDKIINKFNLKEWTSLSEGIYRMATYSNESSRNRQPSH